MKFEIDFARIHERRLAACLMTPVVDHGIVGDAVNPGCRICLTLDADRACCLAAVRDGRVNFGPDNYQGFVAGVFRETVEMISAGIFGARHASPHSGITISPGGSEYAMRGLHD